MYSSHSNGIISPFQQPNYDITTNGAIQAATGTASSSSTSSSSFAAGPVDSIQNLEQLVSNTLEGQQVGQQQSSFAPNFYPSYYSAALATAAATAISNNVIHHWGAAMGGNGGTSNCLDSIVQNKKASGRQTYNAAQKQILEECFRNGKYVTKSQRNELREKTQLTDKQIKIWFQNRRMKEKKTKGGGIILSNGEITHQESPSFSPSNESCAYQQQQQRHGITETGECAADLALSNVKSEPENGIGIGGSLQQQHQIKSEHTQQQQRHQQEGNVGTISNVASNYSYSNEYPANPLSNFSLPQQQQFQPSTYASAANSSTNFLAPSYQCYNPYQVAAAQAQQQFYQQWWNANAGGFVGGGQQHQHIAAAELERKFENELNGGMGNHLLKRE